MTYVPIIPPTTTQQPTDTDHRDLITALKLLSGEECMRDVGQAQVLLVGLTESRHDDVAADARAIMQTGLKQGWFEDAVPNYYTLRNIAERSIATYEKGPSAQQQRLVMALLGGLVALALGVYFFFQASGGESPPYIMIALVAFLIIALFGVLAAAGFGTVSEGGDTVDGLSNVSCPITSGLKCRPARFLCVFCGVRGVRADAVVRSSSAEGQSANILGHREPVEVPWIRFGRHDLHPDRHSA